MVISALNSEVLTVDSLENLDDLGDDFGIDPLIISQLKENIAYATNNLEILKKEGESFFYQFFERSQDSEPEENPALLLEFILTFLPKELSAELENLTHFFKELKNQITEISGTHSDEEIGQLFAKRLFDCSLLFEELFQKNEISLSILEEKNKESFSVSIESFIRSNTLNISGLNDPSLELGTRINFFLIIGRNYDAIMNEKDKDTFLEYFNLLLFRETFSAFSLRETLIHFPNSLWRDWISQGENKKKIQEIGSSVNKVFFSLWDSVEPNKRPPAVQNIFSPETAIINVEETTDRALSVLSKPNEISDANIAQELDILPSAIDAIKSYYAELKEKWPQRKKTLELLLKNFDNLSMVLFLEDEFLKPLRLLLLLLPREYKQELDHFQPLFKEIQKQFLTIDFRKKAPENDKLTLETQKKYENVVFPDGKDLPPEKETEVKKLAFEGFLELWQRIQFLFPLVGTSIEKEKIPFSVIDREGKKGFIENLVNPALREIADCFFTEDHAKVDTPENIFSLYFILAKQYTSNPEQKNFFLGHLNTLLYREFISAFSLAEHLRNLPTELWYDWLDIYTRLILNKETEISKLFVSIWEHGAVNNCPSKIKTILEAIGEYHPFAFPSSQTPTSRTKAENFFRERGTFESQVALFFELAGKYKDLTDHYKNQNRKEIFLEQLGLILLSEKSLSVPFEKLRSIPNRLWNDWVVWMEKNSTKNLLNNETSALRKLVISIWENTPEKDIPKKLQELLCPVSQTELSPKPPTPKKKKQKKGPKNSTTSTTPNQKNSTIEEINFPPPEIEHVFESGTSEFQISNFDPTWKNNGDGPWMLIRLWKQNGNGFKGVGDNTFYVEIGKNGSCKLPVKAIRNMKNNAQHRALFFLTFTKEPITDETKGTEIIFKWNNHKISYPTSPKTPAEISPVVTKAVEKVIEEKLPPPPSKISGEDSESLSLEDKEEFLLEALRDYHAEWNKIIEVDKYPSTNKEDNNKIFRFHFRNTFLEQKALIEDGFPVIEICFSTFRKILDEGYLTISSPTIGDNNLKEKIIEHAQIFLSDYEIASCVKNIKQYEITIDGRPAEERVEEFSTLTSIVSGRGSAQKSIDEKIQSLRLCVEERREKEKEKENKNGNGNKNSPSDSPSLNRFTDPIGRLKDWGITNIEISENKLQFTVAKKYSITCFYEEGAIRIEHPENLPEFLKEKINTIGRKVFSVFIDRFISENTLKKLRKEISNASNESTKETGWKQIMNGNGRKCVFDQNGELIKVISEKDIFDESGNHIGKTGLGRDDFKEGDIVLLRDLVFQFPTEDESFKLNDEKFYDNFNLFEELLNIERNKKYFIARIISTIKTKLTETNGGTNGNGKKYGSKEIIGSEKMWEIITETFKKAGIPLESIAEMKRINELLELNLTIESNAGNKEDWFHYLFWRMKQMKIPVKVRKETNDDRLKNPIVISYGELEKEAKKNKWEGFNEESEEA